MPEAQVLAAMQEGVVQLRVVGRATFKISQHLRDFAINAIEEGVSEIIVELSGCQGMDSTFMGVLAMIGLEGRGSTDVVFVNVSDQHRRLLDSIGVSRLFRFSKKRVRATDWRSICEAADGAYTGSDVAATVLEAHRALMELDPANVPKFKDVVSMLSDEIADGT